MKDIPRDDLTQWLNGSDVKFPLLRYYGWVRNEKIPFLYTKRTGPGTFDVMAKADGGAVAMCTVKLPPDGLPNACVKAFLDAKTASMQAWTRLSHTTFRLRSGAPGRKRYDPCDFQVAGAATTAIYDHATHRYLTWPGSRRLMTFPITFEATQYLVKCGKDGTVTRGSGIVHVAEDADNPAEYTIPIQRTGLAEEGEWYIQTGDIIPVTKL